MKSVREMKLEMMTMSAQDQAKGRRPRKNGSMAYLASRSVENELDYFSLNAKCCAHRWAAERAARKLSHSCFCSICSACTCASYHKLFRNYKAFLVKKIHLRGKFLQDQEDDIKKEDFCKITRAWYSHYCFCLSRAPSAYT